jgi:site-specific DNA-methyltransferase (adenine-specific)
LTKDTIKAYKFPDMPTEELPRIDGNVELRKKLIPLCRLAPGELWEDPEGKHRVGVLDATRDDDMDLLFADKRAQLMVHDPPYNVTVGGKGSDALSRIKTEAYTDFSRRWVRAALKQLGEDAFFYIWLGADQNRGFQPLPEFMMLMREFSSLESRSFITLRNQRGYGTSGNWMSVRQELLCYRRGDPPFTVQYTDIPKILRGYYKKVGGELKENRNRGKSENIRSSNVWVDLQQVFYRREENVPGAYAQKPLAAIERIIASGSREGDLVADFFAHSGTTLLAAERLGRRCFTADIDPVFAELAIRRLERFRCTGKTGWQWRSPFPEIAAKPGGP